MYKKIILILIGFTLIGVDVWLYFQAQSHGGIFLLLFGVGSAVAVPVGVRFIAYALGEKQREAIEKLTKVPEIEKLIEKAQTQEQKIKILNNEYSKLQAIIQSEGERFALVQKKEDLEKNAKRILEELEVVEYELASRTELKGISVEEVAKLRERIQAKRKGDIVIRLGRSQYVIDRELILHFSLFSLLLYLYESLAKAIRTIRQRIK